MHTFDPASVTAAQVVLPCPEPLSASIDHLTSLGFAVRTISPADHPRRALLQGHGLWLALEVGSDAPPARLRLECDIADAISSVAPNGSVLEFVPANRPLVIPPLVESLTISRAADAGESGEGRAGMRYRDLIPDRLGGRFIASHIAIPDGGPVPDYVHFHDVRFQMIFCHRGWVKVLYEDQGDVLTMQAGDCVLQPPTIRHRVVESSPGLHVVEIGCPAEHDTHGDPATPLPTGRTDADRGFGPDGHRFVFHRAAGATYAPWQLGGGFEQRDTGIGSATDGLAGVRVVRPTAAATSTATTRHHAEFWFAFVLAGSIELEVDGQHHRLTDGDAVTIPSDVRFRWSAATHDLELLEVTLPHLAPTAPA